MMTSSNGNIFRVTGPLCGGLTGQRWITLTKAGDAELWCFFDLRLNKRLSKQSRGWLFCRRHCAHYDVVVVLKWNVERTPSQCLLINAYVTHGDNYRRTSDIRRTKSQNLNFLVSSCSCFCPIHWSRVWSRQWRCSWVSAERLCSIYIWVINNFIAYCNAAYIGDLTYVMGQWRC